jgi:hypothetical protein
MSRRVTDSPLLHSRDRIAEILNCLLDHLDGKSASKANAGQFLMVDRGVPLAPPAPIVEPPMNVG